MVPTLGAKLPNLAEIIVPVRTAGELARPDVLNSVQMQRS
jgi:hypothetical protein